MIEDEHVKIAENPEEAYLRNMLERAKKDKMESLIAIELNDVIIQFIKDKLNAA
jgi:hypothetical protein